MPETAGPHKGPQKEHKGPKKERKEAKCEGCLSLRFPPRDKHGDSQTILTPMGRTNHLVNIKSVLTGMGRGCQICFAILKAIDSIIMPHITEPPQPLSEPWPYSQYPDKPPAKASKFPFLDYLQIGLVSIRERGELPVQVHASITLHCVIDKDKFGIGTATGQSRNVAAAALNNINANVNVDVNTELGKVMREFQDWVKFSTLTRLEFNFELFSDPSSPTPFRGIAPARRVPAKLSSYRRRRLVKGWLDECTGDHWDCCQPFTGQEGDGVLGVKTWCPKRLLDLGDSPRTFIRLVDGAGGISDPYATVSHVWNPRGGSDLVLNRDTLPKLMGQRIRWRDLPPVAQDAIVIASEQDIRYLWLHALYVVQDDPQDLAWHVEQAHRTYGHSYLNIAIERSTHLHETCLGTRWEQRQGSRSAGGRNTSVQGQKALQNLRQNSRPPRGDPRFASR